MRTSEATVGGKANLRHGQLAVSNRPIGLTFCTALQAIREVHPRDLPKVLSRLAGCSTSHADRALRNKRTMNADMAMRLLASGEAGARVFEAYVNDLDENERAEAWAAMRRAVRRQELKQRLAASRAELNHLESQLSDLSKSRR